MAKLTSSLISGFSGALLSPRYDNPTPTPEFHHEMWDLCCSDHPRVAIAAPRSHSKSTAVTHAYTLASVLFRESSYVLIVSDTESQASQFLGTIRSELTENTELIENFGVSGLIKETETEIICRMDDGHKFKIAVKGSGQKVRGLIWDSKRPDLVVCHERGTRVLADGEWMNVEDHPTAKHWTTNGFEVEIDGKIERVSYNHRYWAKRSEDSEPEWIEAHELRPGMLLGDS